MPSTMGRVPGSPPLSPQRASAVRTSGPEAVQYGERGSFGPSCDQRDGCAMTPEAGEAKARRLMASSVRRLLWVQWLPPMPPPESSQPGSKHTTTLPSPDQTPSPWVPGYGTRQTGRSSRASGHFSHGVRDRGRLAPWILDRGQGAHRVDGRTLAGWLAPRWEVNRPVQQAKPFLLAEPAELLCP